MDMEFVNLHICRGSQAGLMENAVAVAAAAMSDNITPAQVSCTSIL